MSIKLCTIQKTHVYEFYTNVLGLTNPTVDRVDGSYFLMTDSVMNHWSYEIKYKFHVCGHVKRYSVKRTRTEQNKLHVKQFGNNCKRYATSNISQILNENEFVEGSWRFPGYKRAIKITSITDQMYFAIPMILKHRVANGYDYNALSPRKLQETKELINLVEKIGAVNVVEQYVQNKTNFVTLLGTNSEFFTKPKTDTWDRSGFAKAAASCEDKLDEVFADICDSAKTAITQSGNVNTYMFSPKVNVTKQPKTFSFNITISDTVVYENTFEFRSYDEAIAAANGVLDGITINIIEK